MAWSLAAILVGTMVVGISRPAPVKAQDKEDLAGRWALNRELSEFPREIGFGVDWLSPTGSGQESTTRGGGRGRRSGSGGGAAGGVSARGGGGGGAQRGAPVAAAGRKPSATPAT